jgi:hypothetical protein
MTRLLAPFFSGTSRRSIASLLLVPPGSGHLSGEIGFNLNLILQNWIRSVKVSAFFCADSVSVSANPLQIIAVFWID